MILPMNVDHFEVAPQTESGVCVELHYGIVLRVWLLLWAIIKFKFVPQNSPIIH